MGASERVERCVATFRLATLVWSGDRRVMERLML